MNPIRKRIDEINWWLNKGRETGLWFFQQPLEELKGAWVTVNGRRMLMLSSCDYLGLLGHPKIEAAAQEALARYGTGVHGVPLLSGTLPLHEELERTIARFTKSEAAIVFTSGYVTNLAVVPALVGPNPVLPAMVGRNDVVICDKYDHGSIVDGCLLSQAKFMRFRHNDMADLERRLKQADPNTGRLVIVDAVFSMDGDIINLPEVSRLCRQYDALLMVDEAHSLGVLGRTGHGIEEHFGLEDVVDIKMGTLSKTIPSVGGYVAGSQDLITFLKYMARAFIFSAALPPAQTAAAKASFEVIEQEPERVRKLQRNVKLFLGGVKARGFNTLNSETAVVPICGEEWRLAKMLGLCQEEGIFVLGVMAPAVPGGTGRLRAQVTAALSEEDIAYALDVLERAGRAAGVIK